MALSHSRQSSTSSDISDEFSAPESIPESIPESTSHRSMAPPAVPPSQVLAMERDRYSDEDIRVLYEIVLKAEEILSELTPSSRLPTHALFKAYDEILPRHNLDPDEDQLISKLVFRVGGVKKAISLKEKFKVVMSQMEITVQMDGSSAYESDAGEVYIDPASSDKSLGFINGDHAGDDYIILEDDNDRHLHNANNHADLSVIEQHLENSAIAFRKKHQNKFSATSALRQWQKKSAFIANICDQFDAARQADLEEDVGTKFEVWRTIAAEVDNVPPQYLPPNVYSKRIEGIAVRAHDIHVTRTTLRCWRQSAKEEGSRVRKIEESSDPLERVAAKAHKYMMLSRAFANWSNRWEEESEKAQMAAKVYEMSLKSKAFGLRQRLGDNIHENGAHGVHLDASPSANPSNPESAPEIPLVSDNVGFNVAVEPSGSSSTAVETHEKGFPEASTRNASSKNDPVDTTDEMDETTLLARRHILRMRYYDAWEKYTAENLQRARNFRAEQQDGHIAHAIPIWRSQAEKASLEQETMQYNAKRTSYYNKTVKALDTWRQESQEKMHGHDEILEDYATRANFYYKATRILPTWQNAAEQAVQQQGVLELYANRAEYYYKATNSLPLWRTQTQHIDHEGKKLATYARRADYYYKSRGALLAWHDISKQRRKRRLKEAHLETRRIVKKGMGERCIAQWREKLQPSFERLEVMDLLLEDVTADQESKQLMEALGTWREKAQQREQMGLMSDAMVEGKFLEQWRDQSVYHQELEVEAKEHWKEKTMSRTLKNWNLSSLQVQNRPLIVANALEKKDRRLVRNGFENWYSRTADKLVPIELEDGSYKSVEQVVEDAQHQASLNHARGLLDNWKAAAKGKNDNIQQETYTPTPGRPRLFLGGLSLRETTTPLAPVPSRNWRASETAVRGSAIAGRASRSGRAARNLRVSWAQ
ncbi:Sfi1 spindle body protein-domain-containing protein [Daldinia loculata]|nr:Sfi1 spindle body protein-domain-containing protein [Daldinia loculata]